MKIRKLSNEAEGQLKSKLNLYNNLFLKYEPLCRESSSTYKELWNNMDSIDIL